MCALKEITKLQQKTECDQVPERGRGQRGDGKAELSGRGGPAEDLLRSGFLAFQAGTRSAEDLRADLHSNPAYLI